VAIDSAQSARQPADDALGLRIARGRAAPDRY